MQCSGMNVEHVFSVEVITSTRMLGMQLIGEILSEVNG